MFEGCLFRFAAAIRVCSSTIGVCQSANGRSKEQVRASKVKFTGVRIKFAGDSKNLLRAGNLPGIKSRNQTKARVCLSTVIDPVVGSLSIARSKRSVIG